MREKFFQSVGVLQSKFCPQWKNLHAEPKIFCWKICAAKIWPTGKLKSKKFFRMLKKNQYSFLFNHRPLHRKCKYFSYESLWSVKKNSRRCDSVWSLKYEMELCKNGKLRGSFKIYPAQKSAVKIKVLKAMKRITKNFFLWNTAEFFCSEKNISVIFF